MKTFLILLSLATITLGHACSKSANRRLAEGQIELKLHESAEGRIEGDRVKLGFDAVISDSRCPANAMCIWQGAATAAFSFTKNGNTHRFNLSTITMKPQYTKDTLIAGYKIEFIHLLPYPGTFTPPAPDSQIKAELKITRE
ncbi:MAG TPA: hypothetical protein VFH08_11780 [Chitinophagaceae bacterium]|nr:hypothetical protein [Chitinophagaceae bacterium]